jgi:surface protein
MELIEDDDDAAPHPFNSAEFEDEPRPKIELFAESTNEDGVPPLASTSKASSFNSQNEAPAATAKTFIDGYESIGGDLAVQQIDGSQPSGDEKNIQQRVTFVAGPGNNSPSDNSTVDRNPPVSPIPEARLVAEEEDDVGHGTVFEATPLEPELPWWKQRRILVLLVIICILITALASSLGVEISRPSVDPTSTSVENATPSGSLLPTKSPTTPSYKCFADRKELDAAVERYIQSGCGKAEAVNANVCFDDSQLYGWSMGSWCVGDVTDMSSLFEGRDMFNEDISGWNVGNVTNMNRMFYGATSFSGNVSSWDVSSVTNMREMFKGASSFNENLCDLSKWDTSSVITMESMFDGASAFNCNISSWDTSAVTDMNKMFHGASSFNADISSWSTSAVTDMSWMFSGASSFNPDDLSKWDTSAVTTMRGMFLDASTYNGSISSWNTSAVTDMRYMFYGASAFNQSDLSKWDTSAVTNIIEMFERATSFNQNLCAWKDNFPYSNAADIFKDSGCTYKDDPSSTTQGPFCASSCST